MSAAKRDKARGRRASLGPMLVAGWRAVAGYPGLVAVLYAVQVAMAAVAGFVATRLLASVFAHQTVLDDAVDGDFAALVFVLVDEADVFVHIAWVAIGAVIAYAALSWLLVGGLNAVLCERPRGRREVAARFGAGGAAAFLPYLRLALLSLIPYFVCLLALGIGLGAVSDDLQYGLTVGDMLGALAPALAPGLVLIVITAAAVDYARIELVRDPDIASWRALARGFATVLSRPWPLLHVALYYAFFALITALYVTGTLGAEMAGAGGAVALLAIRQLVSALRFAGKIALVGGQVEHRRPRDA